MKRPKKYKCNSCGMVFFNLTKKLTKKEKKELTCPYCESELWHTLLSK